MFDLPARLARAARPTPHAYPEERHMNRKSVGMLMEYVGYLVLILVLYQWSQLAGELGIGALVAYFGIRLRHSASSDA